MATAKRQSKGDLPAAEKRKLARQARRKKKVEAYHAAYDSAAKTTKQAEAAARSAARDEYSATVDVTVSKVKRYQDMTDEQLQWFEEQVVLGTPVDDMPQLREDFPSQYMLWRGIADTHSKLSQAYTRGKELAVARKEELIEKIAATPMIGTTTVRGQRVLKDGTVVDIVETREEDMLGHRTLLIETHKWALAHLKPRKHGRHADPEVGKPNEQLKALFDSLRQGPAE